MNKTGIVIILLCFLAAAAVVIDAKSILGVMSLDLTQILTVEYMGEDAEYEAFLDTMEANNVTAA